MKYNIWKDCPKVPITELLSFIVDNRGKTVPTAPYGHKLIATNCVTNNTLFPVYEKIRYLNDETYHTWFRAHPIPGDILFVNKGTPGRVCMVPDPVDFCIAQDMIALRADDTKIYNKYLFAVLQFLDQLLIPVPDRSIQKDIGDCYYLFSYKIELNNKINENLWQQLFVLYENTVTSSYAKKIVLSDLCNFQEGYVNPAQTHPEYFNGEVKWLRAVDINESFITETSRTLTKAGFESAKKSAVLFKPNTIAISKSGTIGRLGIVADYMCGNRAVINIAPHDTNMLAFIYCFLKNKQREFPNMAVGSVQKNLYVSLLEPLVVTMPEHKALVTFNSIGALLLKKIYNNCIENSKLGSFRDLILPRLMSGKIDIGDVNI